MHSLLLELDINKFAPRPVKEDGSLVRSNSKEYKEWFASIGNKTPIDPHDYADAMAILSSACNHEKFTRAFELSDKEASFYARHENGLYLKARPDMIAKDRSFILDVKSTSNIQSFQKQIFNLGYDIRLVHYAETVRALEGTAIPDLFFFAIESSAPYGCKMFRLSDAARESALLQWQTLTNEIAVCTKEDRWPSYSDEIAEVDRPAWMETPEVDFGVGA
jgi:hypothetical protein